jgi:hypothetical protein
VSGDVESEETFTYIYFYGIDQEWMQVKETMLDCLSSEIDALQMAKNMSVIKLVEADAILMVKVEQHVYMVCGYRQAEERSDAQRRQISDFVNGMAAQLRKATPKIAKP